MFFKKLTKQEKMEIKKAKYIKKKDKLFPYPKRGYFERVCPYCKKEFIQELFLDETVWYSYALDGFPLTGEKKPFDVSAHEYAICPHCGFMFYDSNEKDESEPVLVFESFIKDEKDAELLKDTSYTFEEKILGVMIGLEQERSKSFLYLYGIQTNDKKLMKEVRQWFIKNYEKYKNDKDHHFYCLKAIRKYAFNAITTEGYVYHHPTEMIMDFYRQEGEFDKAKELLDDCIKDLQKNMKGYENSFAYLSQMEFYNKEQKLILSENTQRI